MSTLLGTRAGVKSVKFWQLSSCWFIFRWWLFLRVCPLGAQLAERQRGLSRGGQVLEQRADLSHTPTAKPSLLGIIYIT